MNIQNLTTADEKGEGWVEYVYDLATPNHSDSSDQSYNSQVELGRLLLEDMCKNINDITPIFLESEVQDNR